MEAGEALEAVRAEVANACARRLGSAIRAFTLASAEARQRAGQLEFHDLLVLARALLRDAEYGPTVRATLHERYDRLLLDEFQDTDPIQIELAVRIAAADPSDEKAGSEPWETVDVAPGHLFVVGDPKQSIYRFRRADIATFLRAGRRFGPEGGGVVELIANFRTVRADHRAGSTTPSRPSWANRSTTPCRRTSTRSPSIWRSRRPGRLHERAPRWRSSGATSTPRARRPTSCAPPRPSEVALTVTRIMGEGWDVSEKDGTWRPARLGDITVLVPARTSLPFLEDAFEQAGIAFRAETSSLVYASRAVRDLLMVLRAVDDPTNYLHIVSALRTPLLACGDDDLFRFKWERKGRWSYLADQPDTVPPDDPVRIGLSYLRSLYEQRTWSAPSELLGSIARDRRALELGFAEGRPRDVWRRLRFVIDQARAWSEATGGNLRQYLHWVAVQTAEGARVTESILPESDDDAVRILTIHGAKGLEFPITIVSGMSTAPSGRAGAGRGGVSGDRAGWATSSARWSAPRSTWTGRRSTNRWGSTSGSACCTWRARGRVTTWWCRCIARSEPRSRSPRRARTPSSSLAGMGDAVGDLPDGVDGDGWASSRTSWNRRRLRHPSTSGRPSERRRFCSHLARRRWPPPP